MLCYRKLIKDRKWSFWYHSSVDYVPRIQYHKLGCSSYILAAELITGWHIMLCIIIYIFSHMLGNAHKTR